MIIAVVHKEHSESKTSPHVKPKFLFMDVRNCILKSQSQRASCLRAGDFGPEYFKKVQLRDILEKLWSQLIEKKNTWIINRFKTYSPLIVCYYHLTVGSLISMEKFSVTFTHEKNVRGCGWFRNWGLKNRNSCLSFVDIEKIWQTFITGYMNKKKIS